MAVVQYSTLNRASSAEWSSDLFFVLNRRKHHSPTEHCLEDLKGAAPAHELAPQYIPEHMDGPHSYDPAQNWPSPALHMDADISLGDAYLDAVLGDNGLQYPFAVPMTPSDPPSPPPPPPHLSPQAMHSSSVSPQWNVATPQFTYAQSFCNTGTPELQGPTLTFREDNSAHQAPFAMPDLGGPFGSFGPIPVPHAGELASPDYPTSIPSLNTPSVASGQPFSPPTRPKKRGTSRGGAAATSTPAHAHKIFLSAEECAAAEAEGKARRARARASAKALGVKPPDAFACPVLGCGQMCGAQMRRHIWTHGPKQLLCCHAGCTAAFSRPDALKRHLGTHAH